ncbi:DUF948 domain-containing protein [Acidithiobacillus sp. YTS05]|uniref:DUF948 domain-containing protein n=1 Tax=Igneacidithiobacillus copahuensis TaxID=2724909 RepID=UPI001D010A6D|nr:DUF948 domain-containing protein [Igneacidithiobacillus copahuensis]UTV82224.1 DUF948 domain-containing protein [Acidithiobacillus sp. YTS05]
MAQESQTPTSEHHNLAGLSDRQLRMIVFAGLTAFLVLAAYEFYLAVAMSRDLREMTKQVQALSPNVQRNMDSMAQNMRQMTASTNYMAQATGQMQADFWSLNKNVSPPFSFFAGMVPWAKQRSPYSGPDRPLPLPPQADYPAPYGPPQTSYPDSYGRVAPYGYEMSRPGPMQER